MSTFSFFANGNAGTNEGANNHGGAIGVRPEFYNGHSWVRGGTLHYAYNGGVAESHFASSFSHEARGRCWNDSPGFSAITCTEIGSGPD